MPEVSDDGWGPERRVASRSASPAPQAKPVRQMPPPHAQAPRRVQPAQPGPAPRGEHAPPLIYFGASAVLLYFRSGGFKDRGVLIDAVSNWLVYGFPAIAGASAVVLIVAGGRLILNK